MSCILFSPGQQQLPVVTASHFWLRLRGWNALNEAQQRGGLFLPKCHDVHGWGLHQPLRLLWLTEDTADTVSTDGQRWTVVQDEILLPRRFASCEQAQAVLEMPADATFEVTSLLLS